MKLPRRTYGGISTCPASFNISNALLFSITKPHSKHQQANIRPKTQRSQNHNRIPTRPKLLPAHAILPHFTEKLSVPFVPPIQTHEHDPHSICSKQGADAVEFGSEDFEDHECKGELPDCRADVRPLKRSLRGTNFDESLKGKRLVR
jgi:hypothetical protein